MIQMSRPYSRYRPPALSQMHPQAAVLHNSLCTCARLDSLTVSLSVALSFSRIRSRAPSPALTPAPYFNVSAVAFCCSCLLGIVVVESRRNAVIRQGEEDCAAAGVGRFKRRRQSERQYRDSCTHRQRRKGRRSSVCGRRLTQQHNVSDMHMQFAILRCLNRFWKHVYGE